MEEQITQCRQALQNLQKTQSEESVADSAATPAKRRATEDPDGDIVATPPPKQAREAKSTQKAAAALAKQALILEALTAQLSRHAEALDQKQDVAAATVEQATSKARSLFASAKRAALAHKARQRLDKTARARTAAAEKAAAAKETGEAVAGAAAETAAAKAAEAKKTGEAASTQAGEEEQAAAEKAAEAKKTDEAASTEAGEEKQADAKATDPAAEPPPLPPPAQKPPASRNREAQTEEEAAARAARVLAKNATPQVGDWIRISSEEAADHEYGVIGQVTVVRPADDQLDFQPNTSVAGKGHTTKKTVQISRCVIVDGTKPAIDRAPWGKQNSHLSKAKCKRYRQFWQNSENPALPGNAFQGETGGERPGRDIVPTTVLDFPELDAAVFEVLWRTLPESTVAAPVLVSRTLVEAGRMPLQVSSDVCEAAVAANTASFQGAKTEFMKFADRARLLLVPIYGIRQRKEAAAPLGHWTLLAAVRTSTSQLSPSPAADSPPSPGRGERGCPGCRNTSCAACNPKASARKEQREAQEDLIFDQLSRPILDGCSEWEFSYFDGLMVDHADCKSAAELVAEVLQGKPVKLDRVNRKHQDACECGFRAAYWAEEMCRRQRGEGSWTFAYSVADRADKVQKVVSQLKKHRSSVQSQVIRRV